MRTDCSSAANSDVAESQKGQGAGHDVGSDIADDHHFLWAFGNEFVHLEIAIDDGDVECALRGSRPESKQSIDGDWNLLQSYTAMEDSN